MNLQFKILIQVPSFLFLMTCLVHISAQETRSALLMGKVIDAAEKKSVSYALIVKKSTRESAFSDSLGFFSIRVSPGDTLYISRVGYFHNEFSVTPSLLALKRIHYVELTERSNELSAININTLGSYQDFKYRVIHSELPDEKEKVNPAISKAFSEKVVVLEPQAKISLGSPVTAIYMMLSKEGKSLRKLEKLKEEEREVLSYSDKYNALIVSDLTGLKELELEKFMKYCNPDINFIINSTEVDIAARILECFKNYNAEKSKTTLPDQ